MNRVKNNLDYLKILCNCKQKMLKSIVANSDKEFINCICECVLNCLNGNVKLNDEEKRKLKKHKNTLRELLDKKKSIKRKKLLLTQHGGGFLPFLIPTIIQALSSFLVK